MINPKIIGMILIVAAAVSIGLVTIGFQSTMATGELDNLANIDEEEAAAAENASIAAGANETGTGNMTGVESQNAQSGSISGLAEGEETTNSGTDSHAEGEGTTTSGTDSHAEGG